MLALMDLAQHRGICIFAAGINSSDTELCVYPRKPGSPDLGGDVDSDTYCCCGQFLSAQRAGLSTEMHIRRVHLGGPLG